jgi:hypothetical protein
MAKGFGFATSGCESGKFSWWPSSPHGAAKTLAAHQLHVLLCAGNPEAVQAAPVWRSVSPAD